MIDYAIATFCYGERYHNQTNKMIESFDYMESKPLIFVVTDNVESITKREFVNTKSIADFNSKYLNFNTDYFTFDFSVKRFSLQYAFDNGYTDVILVDTDVQVNQGLYSHESIMQCFLPNTVAGQVTYNFNEQIKSNSELGKRFLYYESKFNVKYDKNQLDFMPEDCVQFISIEEDLKYKFLDTWNECIKIKDTENLRNVPAGNIDEMCFSALYNGLAVTNNSNKHYNLLIPKHDKWYYR